MAKNKQAERIRREIRYEYEIGLLIKGLPCSDVYILSNMIGNKLSLRTIQRMRKEFITTPYER